LAPRLANSIICVERRRHGDRRGVGATAPERRDVPRIVGSLEARDDGHLTVVERLQQRVAIDALDARMAVRAVGAHTHLRSGERARRLAHLLKRHGQQRDRLLLSGGDEHVVFARARILAAQLAGERDQGVGLTGHRRDHDSDAIARLHRLDYAPGDVPDLVGIADARPAKLLNHERHRFEYLLSIQPKTARHPSGFGQM
jgi:hypothetical protein